MANIMTLTTNFIFVINFFTEIKKFSFLAIDAKFYGFAGLSFMNSKQTTIGTDINTASTKSNFGIFEESYLTICAGMK